MKIKKHCLTALSVISVALIFYGAAAAMPALPKLRSFSQPDGSVIQLRLIGDEFFHEYMDEDGVPYKRDSSGFFHKADVKESVKLRKQASELRKKRKTVAKVAAGQNSSQVKHVGEVHVPVLLVQYKDVKFRDSHPAVTFNYFFNEDNISAGRYFSDQSNGEFTPKFDIYGPITLNDRRISYGGNGANGYDRGVGLMVAEACEGLDSSVDFSRYDYNDDGECDVVIVLYAGDGEASSSAYNAAEAIWPCQWDLESSDYERVIYLDDTKINKFAVFNELNGENRSKIDGIGTFCHEFSHCLGLPDFYDTQYGAHFGMGYWSLMDHGGYNNDGYTPVGYSAYEKEYMGWMDIPEAESETFYTLLPMNNLSGSGDMALKLTNPEDSNEFYILEARMKKRWDAYMSGEGLLITHFTYDADAWEQNYVNDFDPQRATVIPADSELALYRTSYFGQIMYYVDRENEKTDLWPQEGSASLTDTTVPAATVNTGGFMSKPILDIVRNDSDGSVSFSTGRFLSDVKSIGLDNSSYSEDGWWTFQGLRLTGIPSCPGLYIHRRGGKTYKELIK